MRVLAVRLMRAALLSAVFAVLAGSASQAAQLIMVGMRSCEYCAAFSREVEPTYAQTEAGKVAPLRHVHVRSWPADLANIRRARQTPYFILVDHGHEVGRFAGYFTPEGFWADLKPLLAKL